MVPKNNDGVREIKVQPKHQENPIIQAEESRENSKSVTRVRYRGARELESANERDWSSHQSPSLSHKTLNGVATIVYIVAHKSKSVPIQIRVNRIALIHQTI